MVASKLGMTLLMWVNMSWHSRPQWLDALPPQNVYIYGIVSYHANHIGLLAAVHRESLRHHPYRISPAHFGARHLRPLLSKVTRQSRTPSMTGSDICPLYMPLFGGATSPSKWGAAVCASRLSAGRASADVTPQLTCDVSIVRFA